MAGPMREWSTFKREFVIHFEGRFDPSGGLPYNPQGTGPASNDADGDSIPDVTPDSRNQRSQQSYLAKVVARKISRFRQLTLVEINERGEKT